MNRTTIALSILARHAADGTVEAARALDDRPLASF